MRTACLFALLCLGAAASAQRPETLRRFQEEPHVGPVESALVGIEVSGASADGKTRETRRGNGFVLRCDGFVLAPASLFARAKGQGEAGHSVTVVLHPGTEKEQRIAARPPRPPARHPGYVVFKLKEVHVPALRALLPDTLRAGDAAEAAWSAWDAESRKFLPVRKRAVRLGDPAPDNADAQGLAGPLDSAPPGAVIIGPDGMAVGLLPGGAGAASFLTFARLDQLTNCVTPLPTPDSRFGMPPAEQAREEVGRDAAESPGGRKEMVVVPGGPILLPVAVQNMQPDMQGAKTACVAPFRMDAFEVTNREYHAFWKSLPEQARRAQALFWPLSWSLSGPPFPSEIAESPVLGAPLAGAKAYARAKGKRLPTPYEWSLAAFGPRGEAKVAEWAKFYIADRNQTAQQVQQAHLEYVRAHPQILPSGARVEQYLQLDKARIPINTLLRWDDFLTAGLTIPWLVNFPGFVFADALTGAVIPFNPESLKISEWSRQTVETALDHLYRDWEMPDFVLPVGARRFDVSPYGARDMILNAEELVAPSPYLPYGGNEFAMRVAWAATDSRDLPANRRAFLAASAPLFGAPVPPLSRLAERSTDYPPLDLLTARTNFSAAQEMLRPLAGWAVQMRAEKQQSWKYLHRPRGGDPIGLLAWVGMPKHFRREIGRIAPLAETGPPRLAFGELTYLLPRGFRCAR